LAGPLSTFGYGYDPLNRVTSYSGPEGSLSYRYFSTDELDQVTGSRSEDYDFDLNGNRQTAGADTYSTTDPNLLATHGNPVNRAASALKSFKSSQPSEPLLT
jgi:uncharacterized protein RhaS with RHS repeats